jgi:hypothetical protein
VTVAQAATNANTDNHAGAACGSDITFEATDGPWRFNGVAGTVLEIVHDQSLFGGRQRETTICGKLHAVDDAYVSVCESQFPATSICAYDFVRGVSIGNLYLRTSGVLRLRNGSVAIGSDTAPLTLGAIYRVGIRQKRGTGADGILQAYVAAGDNPFGTPFASTTSGTWTTQADRLRLGATLSVILDATFDDIRLDSASMPGPSGP